MTITEKDNELLEKAELKKTHFLNEMITYKHIWSSDETNDYILFLFIASIMNFVEYHNGGCLTDVGMKSLKLDVSPYIARLHLGEKLNQKDLVRFLLNLLNSYAVSFLCKGLFEFAKESSTFFEINKFPDSIKEDFEKLELKLVEIIPKLKQILDTYTTQLDSKYKLIFVQEKTKGFVKTIFDANAIKLQTNTMPSGLENARECK
jgi:hypothetical protein